MANKVFKADPYPIQCLTPEEAEMVKKVYPNNREKKKELLDKHRLEHAGILDRVSRNGMGFNTDHLLNLIIEDMLVATEDLQGTALMMEDYGDLANSSTVVIRRADLLRLVADIVSKKKELSQRSGEFDLNSPVFLIFQKLCFERMMDSLEELKLDPEMVNLVLTKWQEKMREWGRDLKRALKELEES